MLFAADEIDAFISAITALGQKSYNEVLARLRWGTNHTSKIFIASDNLSCRLQAVENARILKNYLMQRGLIDEVMEIPIIYYMPNTSLHFTDYTAEERALDLLEAQEQYRNNPDYLQEMGYYQVLLGLPNEDLHQALKRKNTEGVTFFETILKAGYMHLIDSFSEKLNIPLSTMLKDAFYIKQEFQHDIAYYLLKHNRNHDVIHMIKYHYGPLPSLNELEVDPFDRRATDTLIHLAVREKQIDIIAELYAKNGSSVFENRAGAEGFTALHEAASNNDLRMIIWLEKHGADMYAKTLRKHTNILFMSILADNSLAVGYLLTKHSKLIKHELTPLCYAAYNNSYESVKCLIKHGANVNKESFLSSPLAWAAKSGSLQMIDLLIQNGAQINPTNKELISPLIVAAVARNLAVVKHLVENRGAKVPANILLSSTSEIKGECAIYLKEMITNQEKLLLMKTTLEVFRQEKGPLTKIQAFKDWIQQTKFYNTLHVQYLEKEFYRFRTEHWLQSLAKWQETLPLIDAPWGDRLTAAVETALKKIQNLDEPTTRIFEDLEQEFQSFVREKVQPVAPVKSVLGFWRKSPPSTLQIFNQYLEQEILCSSSNFSAANLGPK